jgi:hypothetical protein
VLVNGERLASPVPGTFARVERTWRAGDRVEIDFPMRVRTSSWFNDSIAVERGPLVFSYGIGENWVKLGGNGLGSADWQVFPTSPWNYALDVDMNSPETTIKVAESPMGEGPFTGRHTPVRLLAPGRQVKSWRADDGAANPLPQSPLVSEEPKETLTLIPYAAAKLRITAFPRLKS